MIFKVVEFSAIVQVQHFQTGNATYIKFRYKIQDHNQNKFHGK